MALGARGTNCLRPANFLYNSKMNFNSKKISLIILGITSLLLSRLMFFFFNDSEGPNLVVIIGMAMMVYFLSLALYLLKPLKIMDLKRLLLTIFIQIIVVTIFFFCLRSFCDDPY